MSEDWNLRPKNIVDKSHNLWYTVLNNRERIVTITQAKNLKLGQRVTNIQDNCQGTVVGNSMSTRIGIHWDGQSEVSWHSPVYMHSIHILANPLA